MSIRPSAARTLGVAAAVTLVASWAAAEPIALERYAGRWYEHARLPNEFQDNTPRDAGERLSACADTTATYASTEPNRISVVNRCLRRAPSGRIVEDIATGRATVKNPPENTRLSVAFGPAVARFFQNLAFGSRGNYWIYGVGAPNADGLYAWSVVGGPDKDYMWILTRERTPDPADVEAALAVARAAGLPVDGLIYTQSAE